MQQNGFCEPLIHKYRDKTIKADRPETGTKKYRALRINNANAEKSGKSMKLEDVSQDESGIEDVRQLIAAVLQKCVSSHEPVRVASMTCGRRTRFVVSTDAAHQTHLLLDAPARVMILAVARSLNMKFSVEVDGSGRNLLA